MIRHTAVAAAALFLAGCASFSPDGGFDKVASLTKERTGQAPTYTRNETDLNAASSRVMELLKNPLTAEGAVELAYLNNRNLQASFSDLGVAEADLVQAGRLRNPSFSFGRISGNGFTEIDRSVMFDVLGLLTLPLKTQVEQRRFEQVQLRAAYDAVGVAAEVRHSYFMAIAAQQLTSYFTQVKDAAEASNDLARRMVQAGNLSKLDQMRQQSFYADATAQLARAQQRAASERERLTRLLGLSSAEGFQLPERLPDLPNQAAEPLNAEQTAVDKRLDVLIAKRAAEATARSLGLTRTTRFVNVLDLGYQNKSQTGLSRENGYQLSLELPLFDFGATRVAQAQATYMQAVHRAAAAAINARSEVRESYNVYRTAFDLARHYRDEVVPLRKRISDENLLRYNGMLIDVFELLADSREQVSAVSSYVESLRDFWLADADLQTAVTGRSPSGLSGASGASNN